MEFDIDINSLLREVITKVDNRLQVCRSAAASFPDARLRLFEIVNKMGEASARAQGLAGAITTGRRLETSDHHLYIMKDPEGSRGKGAVIGILKIGRKRLFVYDRHGQQWEMNPLCILDFYVHESRQRMGCGRRLFDFMLNTESMAPQHLAVDRPSLKFSSFLAKHYGLKAEIPQVNNFVIFEGFFTKHPEGHFIQNRRNANQAKPADYPRQGGTEIPTSWPSSNYNNNTNNKLHNHHRANTSLSNHGSRPPSGPHTKMIAAGLPSVMPRHQTSVFQQETSLKELNLNPRSAQALNNSGNGSPRGLSDLELRSVSAGSGNNRASNLQLQSSMYSRHQTVNNSSAAQPHYSSVQRPADPNPAQPHGYSAAQRPPSSSNDKNVPGASSNNVLRHRPPSGSRNAPAKREKTPPLLQRDGPPKDYMDSFNLHQNYQGRAGHLVVPSDPRGQKSESNLGATGTTSTSSASQQGNNIPSLNTSKPVLDNGRSAYSHRGGYYTNPALHATSDTSWTVFGVLRNQNHFSARHSGRTRLW